MERILKMPRLGMNMEEGTISQWYVNIGDCFKEGAPICQIESDKTINDFLAPFSGKLTEILIANDGTAAVAAPIAKCESIQ